VKLTYLGHATFLLETGSTSILIDPYDDKDKTEAAPGLPLASVDQFAAGAKVSKQAGHATAIESRSIPREPEVWVMGVEVDSGRAAEARWDGRR